MLNSNKLKGKIVEQGMTQDKLAEVMGISVQALNAKLNGRAPLLLEEADKIIDILKIKNPIEIFFPEHVPKMQQ